MMDRFKTITKKSEGLYKEKGSKFLAFAYPVENESDIKEILEELRKKYHDARHHCYAWQLGTDQSLFRANDDGEPSYSAGKPILGQIHSFGLTNVLVVVVRYFGGTLLGVGGLIAAYREAARDALENAHIADKKIFKTFRISFEYPLMNDIMHIIKENKIEQFDQDFNISCSLKIKVWRKESNKIMDKLKLLENVKIEDISG